LGEIVLSDDAVDGDGREEHDDGEEVGSESAEEEGDAICGEGGNDVSRFADVIG
jgi:hypothetical protein